MRAPEGGDSGGVRVDGPVVESPGTRLSGAGVPTGEDLHAATSAVAAAGPIAFIALSAPQIARRLTQAPRVQVVTSALVGAGLLLAADLISIHLPVKIAMPVGLTTGLLGGIYLLWLLTRTRAV